MNPESFAYWLMGFFELCEAGNGDVLTLNDKQVATIKQHLALVFVHAIDPSEAQKLAETTGCTVEQAQAMLQKIHDKGKKPKLKAKPYPRPRPGGDDIVYRC